MYGIIHTDILELSYQRGTELLERVEYTLYQVVNMEQGHVYIIKMKIHSSCETEDFVETHLCKLCVILRSRVLRVVYPN